MKLEDLEHAPDCRVVSSSRCSCGLDAAIDNASVEELDAEINAIPIHMTAEELIIALRGGIPVNCDFCNQPMKPSDAIPEEAGDWACRTCWDRWEKERP